jgi:hypothetical protein
MRTSILKTSFIILLSLVSASFAAAQHSVEIFASNNTEEINVEAAYKRLDGPEQRALKNNIIDILQAKHFEQGRFVSILGVYQMADKNLTGDNTEIFYASPQQHFFKEEIFAMTAKLLVALQQESIAVFFPDERLPDGDFYVVFKSQQPLIKNVIKTIHEKLPANYASAFSLHLVDHAVGFEQARVKEIEWLGSKVNVVVIKKAFPTAEFSAQHGKAYLIYKDGRIEDL